MLDMGRKGNVFYTYFTSRWNGEVYKVEVEYDSKDTPMDMARKLSAKADQMELLLLERNMYLFSSFLKKEDLNKGLESKPTE